MNNCQNNLELLQVIFHDLDEELRIFKSVLTLRHQVGHIARWANDLGLHAWNKHGKKKLQALNHLMGLISGMDPLRGKSMEWYLYTCLINKMDPFYRFNK